MQTIPRIMQGAIAIFGYGSIGFISKRGRSHKEGLKNYSYMIHDQFTNIWNSMIGFMGFGKVLHIFCQNNGLLSFQDAPRINPNRSLDRLTHVFVPVVGFPNASILLPTSCQPLCLDVARYAIDKSDSQSARQ